MWTAAIGSWFDARWQDTVIPLAVFVGVLAVALTARRFFGARLTQWATGTKTRADDVLVAALAKPSWAWAFLGAAAIALESAQVSGAWKQDVARGIWTLFALSLAFAVAQAVNGLLTTYGQEVRLQDRVVRAVSRGTMALIGLITILVLMELWGLAIGPVLIGAALVLVVAGLLLRDVVPSALASLTLTSSGQLRHGDFIKLESGEAGYVNEIKMGQVQITSTDGTKVLIPSSKLFRVTVVNYGRRPRQAKAPFVFSSRTFIREITGLKATSLKEFAAVLKAAPESGIFYHTHHFLEEHQYLIPEPANDFAIWVRDALGEEQLAERLASVDTFEFSTIEALRSRLAGVVDEYLANGDGGRTAREGREFYLIKSASFIFPNGRRAYDLREFAEVLRDLPLNSLYFHVFEARMRLGKPTNDFALWLEESCDAPDLAQGFAQLDPYNHTLEALRSSLVRLVEQYIA